MWSRRPSRSPIADGELGPLGADRELVLLHVPSILRGAFDALFGIDAAMADVVARSSDPALGRIKLAWWREQLGKLDVEEPPAEPRLRGVADYLLSIGVSGADLAALETGWATLLDPEINPQLVAGRGAHLFRIGGRILGGEDELLGNAGELYALVSVGRRGVPELFAPAEAAASRVVGHRFRRNLRSLTGLARLAMRDLRQGQPPEPEGSAGRAAEMLRHRWSGLIR